MKVLFAVNNENISESIIKKYQQDYKEIISAKNVYYFNAIIKELQKDKTYDRIIISEDLQPFSNNNTDVIDKFIFEKLDNISDEATNQSGNDIPIILICGDQREKSDPLLVKLFGIGIYDALLGKDRSITKVCELLEKPRTKKEAKVYYRIDADDVDYKVENEGDVSEVEIQNILNHYKKINGNEEKYVESFDHIASQYTDQQLRLIANFLPLNVKAVLEANSAKYQEVVSFGAPSPKGQVYKAPPVNSKNAKPAKNQNYNQSYNQNYNQNYKTNYKPEKINPDAELDLVQKSINKNRMTEPVVIPSAINTANVKKMGQNANTSTNILQEQEVNNVLNSVPTQNVPTQNVLTQNEQANLEANMQMKAEELSSENAYQQPNSSQNVEAEPPKRRGRPKKVAIEEPKVEETSKVSEAIRVGETSRIEEAPVKKGRGRPRKEVKENVVPEPEQVQEATNTAPVNLFELGEEDTGLSNSAAPKSSMVLPGIEYDELFDENEMLIQSMQEEGADMFSSTMSSPSPSKLKSATGNRKNNIPNSKITQNANQMQQNQMKQNANVAQPIQNVGNETLNQTTPIQNINQSRPDFNSIEPTNAPTSANISGLISQDKKLVAFVGTSKNGTSFLVNNIAELLSQKGINTAILDLTKNKNAYYIYTENEENLRETAYSCIENLKQGNATGIAVHKNLTVYTTLPGEDEKTEDYAPILQTLMKNYSLVILDCDFETNYNYFNEAQELYLVQSLDVLTIQPLTAFLRNLKAKNALYPEKIRIVLNKLVKLRSISEKTIIGGMAYYNDPAMSFMTELFNKDTAQYTIVSFEEQAYAKYLEALINCKITLNGYSKNFLLELNKLGDMVYPLINNTKNKYNNYQPQNNFSNDMNNTLNKMKNNY